ncbi:protein IQ-DOMAIN 32 [Cocos nucifera]|uniref:Protein IQ-DOMAIN 32 n=1 Tax=Cocos nucifera TaxID=13894 RepID=A0A8K0N3W4_COCNU|nr:protein IQ-DOMAIN 32 [Cocos nucifera]
MVLSLCSRNRHQNGIGLILYHTIMWAHWHGTGSEFKLSFYTACGEFLPHSLFTIANKAVGLLDVIPQRVNWRPPCYYGRNDLETMMASDSAADWIRISEMLLGKSKASLDKGRWSFRKRSASHLVQSNSVISEPFLNTKIAETVTNDFHSEKESTAPENPTITEETDEKPSLSVVVDSEVADTVHSSVPESTPRLEHTNEILLSSAVIDPEVSDSPLAAEVRIAIDDNFQDDAVIVLQAAIRGYLAQKEFEKWKSVVKLQAAVRGHLVRRQAVGTLRCVQAIIKMQALARARHAHQLNEKFAAEGKLDEKLQVNGGMKSDIEYTSVDKLLSNAFARLSGPRIKTIHVSCDPLSSDSAWTWLERWMAVMPSEIGWQEDNLDKDYQGEKQKTNFATSEIVNVVPDSVASISSDSKSSPSESANLVEGVGDSIKKNSGECEIQISVSIPRQSNTSAAIDDQEQSQYKTETSGMIEEISESAAPIESEVELIYENSAEYKVNVPPSIASHEMNSVAKNGQEQFQFEAETSGMIEDNTKIGRVVETLDSTTSQVPVQSDATSLSLLGNNAAEPGFDMENLKCAIERATCESLETEGKKFALRSRRASSPAFASVQSKFEELGAVSSGSSSATSVNQGAEVQSKLVHPHVDSLMKIKELSMMENSTSHCQVKNSALECAVEISVSSPSDLPEGSEVDGKGNVFEIGALNAGNHNLTDGAGSALNNENTNSETKFHLSESDVSQPQELEESDKKLFSTVTAVDSVQEHQLPAESTTSRIQIQVQNLKDTQVCSSSPEGSSRSHAIASEPHGTPSSQISTKIKTTKAGNNIHAQKQRSQSACKNSPSIQKNDSGARKSTEYLPKDAKNAERCNTFGMAKPDHIDHEPRDSSSISLPRYMQTTESARAKFHDSVSPKSSPDVHDKDDHMKKRHSLPIGNVKDSSPEKQKSAPRAQQNLKRNGTHSPQDCW